MNLNVTWKRRLSTIALGALMMGAVPTFGHQTASADGAQQLQIKDIAGKNTYLMSDGSMWSMVDGNRTIYTKGSVDEISGNVYEGLGITRDGRLVEWDIGMKPHVVEGKSGIKQVSGPYRLQADGTVWAGDSKLKNLSGITLIGYGEKDFAALTQSGELLFEDPYKTDQYKKVGTVNNAGSVKSMAVHDDRVALLYTGGEVVVYQMSNFDDNGRVIPVTVATDAEHISYVSAEPTDVLIVTRKDGTVWQTGEYSNRWKLTTQVQGLSNVVKTAVDSYKDDLAEGIYAQRADGTWVISKDGEVRPVEVPAVKAVSMSVSDKKPYVGDTVQVDIQETYTNGAKLKVPLKEAQLDMDKPYLLKVQPDGKLKVAGVGETKLTVTSGSVSSSVTVTVSLRDPLKYAKQVKGTVYLPAKTVFKALGGTAEVSGGNWNAALGDAKLSFKAGSQAAQFNGSHLTLKVPPIIDKGETYIPASLLADTLGAKVTWDAKWQQAEVALGQGKMTIVSQDTAGLIKKAMQGSLAKFIGKTYWVNDFDGWERFSKVTVTDVLPTDTGSFVVVFKSAAGKTLKSYAMNTSEVTQLFADSTYFLKYDPYTKYKWSSSVWSQIKAGNVTLGMTKEQVLLSWGNPAAKDIQSVNGTKIETWGWSNYDVVSFIDGKVTLIIM